MAAKPTLYGGFPIGGQPNVTWTISRRNIIESASTGATLWASGNPRSPFNASLGAGAGGYIIFIGRYSSILAEPTR